MNFASRPADGLRSLARCAAAARNPRSNINRVKVLDFTLWQEQWSFVVRAALCASRMSLARRSIGELSGHRRSIVPKDLRRLRHACNTRVSWLSSGPYACGLRVKLSIS